jgi:hypothetical protein
MAGMFHSGVSSTCRGEASGHAVDVADGKTAERYRGRDTLGKRYLILDRDMKYCHAFRDFVKMEVMLFDMVRSFEEK